jgi:hypothetical protein
MNNDDILTRVHKIYPDLIYIAIGPARNAEQQLPPQIRGWPGQKLCILIDPALESPPLVCSTDDIEIIPVYRNFYWKSPDDANFIHTLCQYVMGRTNAHMIVQSYAGDDIYRHYPGHEFLPRVLFDMTYGDGACYIDFASVQILRDREGNFIQPHFATFAQLRKQTIPVQVRANEVMARRRALINYLHYYYHMRTNGLPSKDWDNVVCANILQYVDQFALIYDQPFSLDVNNLRNLIECATLDLSTATNSDITPEDLRALIDNPVRDVFGNAIGTLCGLLN